jgi:hypothetical protein
MGLQALYTGMKLLLLKNAFLPGVSRQFNHLSRGQVTSKRSSTLTSILQREILHGMLLLDLMNPETTQTFITESQSI